jgi:hypothetical protein
LWLQTSSQSGQNLGQYIGQLSGTSRPIGAYLAEMVDGLIFIKLNVERRAQAVSRAQSLGLVGTS